MEADALRVLQESEVFTSMENHPGWYLLREKMDDMVTDATNKLEAVDPTDTEAVKAAHRDWRAVKQVCSTLIAYVHQTHQVANEILEAQKESTDGNA